MKIILNEDVYNLGEEGDVRNVPRGYARNYLLPKKLAVPYTKGNAIIFEHKKDAIEKRKAEKRDSAMSLKEKIEALSIEIKMPTGETGRLFGSVTNATVSDALAREGVNIEKKKIDIPSHNIKMVGNYKAKIRLYEKHFAELKLTITSENEIIKPESEEESTEEETKEEVTVAEAKVETVEEAKEETNTEIKAEETVEEVEESKEEEK